MTAKKLFGYLHLWLGLASGLVVLVVALTGALYVFQDEIETRLLHPERHFVAVQANRPYAPLAVWQRHADAAFAPYHADSLSSGRSFYWRPDTPGRTAVASTTYRAQGEERYVEAFLNPYTGQVLAVAETWAPGSLWRTVIDLHINLLLGEAGGQMVRWATLFFLLLLVSGIVLWWPKNKAALNQRYRFRWKDTTRWKRKTYDLHNVLGFYASWVVVFMAITGLVWTFKWVENSFYFVLAGGQPAAEVPEIKSRQPSRATAVAGLFAGFCRTQPGAYAEARSVYVDYPSDTAGVFRVTTEFDPPGIVAADNRAFLYDRATGRLLRAGDGWEGRPRRHAADWWRDFNGSIHYGAIFGLPSKLLAFFGCLVVASLPVTGTLVWWNRRNKAVKKGKGVRVAAVA